MKRLLAAMAAVIAILCMGINISADSENMYPDISFGFEPDISSELDSLGIDPKEPESVQNLSTKGILAYISEIVRESLSRPAKLIVICAVFAAVASVSSTLSTKGGLYGELFVMIAFLAVSPSIIDSLTAAYSSMKSAQAFMVAYIPVLGTIVAASGNLGAAVSYNAVVLYFCEAAAAVVTGVLKPILSAMLICSAVQAINPDMKNITGTLRTALTTIVGFIMTVFLGVIGLQSIAGRGAESIALKAGKYAVSSFVPVIGYSLSESYKAVSVSLSAIRSAVGVFGIIVLCVYMLSPIVSMALYKLAFTVAEWLCSICGADRLAFLMRGIRDVYSFSSTVLLMFMLMLTVSTGMMILLGGVIGV